MSDITRLEAIAFVFKGHRYIRIEEGHGNYQWLYKYYNALGSYEGMKEVGNFAQELEDAYQRQEKLNMQIYRVYDQLKSQGKPPFRKG